ncbi:MAG: flagellar protein FlaG [Alphaproteobacteria bacterium]
MEFGSLGFGTQSQTAINQSITTAPPQSATLALNPEYVVTSAAASGKPENELRRDNSNQRRGDAPSASDEKRAPEELQLSSRRTTLNFDSEQNRVFLEVIDRETEKVIERLPSDTMVALIREAIQPLESSSPDNADKTGRTDTSV